jgi:hypothetical protein
MVGTSYLTELAQPINHTGIYQRMEGATIGTSGQCMVLIMPCSTTAAGLG